VTVQANVARSPDEAELQKQGINVLNQQFEEEAAEEAAAAEEFAEIQAEATAEQDSDEA
jgi:large subunit ribosomal protein L9